MGICLPHWKISIHYTISVLNNDKNCKSIFKILIQPSQELTHWGWVTHKCVNKLTIIGSDNGLLPGRRQAIIWTNAGILLIGPLGTIFNGFFIQIHIFLFQKIHFYMSSGKWLPFCHSLYVLAVVDCRFHLLTMTCLFIPTQPLCVHLGSLGLQHSTHWGWKTAYMYINGLVQESRNSSALAIELRLSCTNPSICVSILDYHWFR